MKADEEISKEGKSICPYAIADEEIQAGWNEEEEENLPAPEEDAASHQDDDEHEELPGTPQLRVQGEEDEVPRHLPAGLPLRPPDHLRHHVAQDVQEGQEGDISPQHQGPETTAAQSPEQDFIRREQLPALN